MKKRTKTQRNSPAYSVYIRMKNYWLKRKNAKIIAIELEDYLNLELIGAHAFSRSILSTALLWLITNDYDDYLELFAYNFEMHSGYYLSITVRLL